MLEVGPLAFNDPISLRGTILHEFEHLHHTEKAIAADRALARDRAQARVRGRGSTSSSKRARSRRSTTA